MGAASVLMRYIRARRQLAPGGNKWWFVFSWLISILFHPLLIPTWSALFLFESAPELLPFTEEGKQGILALLFISTFLLPAGGIGLLWASGLIRSLSMEEKKDRHFPHLLAFICYLTVALLLKHFLPMLGLPYYLMLGSAISVGITGIITLFWKISSHLVGAGGFLGFQMAMAGHLASDGFFLPVVFGILVCGAVSSARLFLKAHNGAQLLAGFLLGMVISSLTVTFFAGFF